MISAMNPYPKCSVHTTTMSWLTVPVVSTNLDAIQDTRLLPSDALPPRITRRCMAVGI